MIDLHSHVLPGLDDGPKNMEESLEMCRMAEKDGIHTIVATPHINPGYYETPREIILSKVEELNKSLQNGMKSIKVQILPGSDIHLDPLLYQRLKKGELLSINDNHKYIILELPDHFLSNPTKEFIFNLKKKGIIPIISHPERNMFIQNNVDILYEFIKLGALSQLTAMSITGGFGKKVKTLAQTLLRQNLAHIIATDAHSIEQRPPILSSALNETSKIIGREAAWKMVTETPLAIIEGKNIEIPAKS